MLSKHKKGFTLLELLIVIGIIGVLASIVLISYPSYTAKARFANALQFSDNIRGSLQPDMIAWWKFDETSGTVAKDSWWNQLDGAVYGATWTPGIKNNALSFDGVNDYVDTGLTTALGTNPYSMSVWAKIPNQNQTGVIVGKRQVTIPYPQWTIAVYGTWDGGSGKKIFTIEYNGGNTRYVNTDESYTNNSWHYIVSVRAANSLKLFIDGKLIGEDTQSRNNLQNTDHWRIGDGNGGVFPFKGLIDDVQLYSVALSMAVIQQHYADGLKTHQNLAVK